MIEIGPNTLTLFEDICMLVAYLAALYCIYKAVIRGIDEAPKS